MKQGIIFNIQKYSVHDGPGIRTTVFLKGCPLRCKWCHNPEGLSCGPELVVFQTRCVGCGMCVRACPTGAVSLSRNTSVRISVTDRAKCTVCGRCAGVCPTQAREVAGTPTTPDWVMEQVLKDRIFYEQSGGGVTFSGGEPLMQPGFLLELLKRCKAEGLHTAVDTSGYVPWDSLEQTAPLTDLFLYDIKLMDSIRHLEYTGVSNQPILDNLERLSRAHNAVIARIPVIPGVNDDAGNIEATGQFLAGLGIMKASILPYHNIGSDKYARLGKRYALKHIERPSDEAIWRLKDRLEGFGLAVKIGG
ncbi:MAG: glycyl-radical enzyme activating protein [Bacillota bacterium]|nr:glycyl-radical enzyme activating protein [Candidatus Fermentithermobacillaceae bacterium]